MPFVALACCASLACATATTGTSEKVRVTTDPPGAHVKVLPTGEVSETPAEFELSKSNAYVIRITMDCFDEQRVEVANPVHPALFGNILLGGVIGMIVDVSSGGGFNLEPDEFDVVLVPVQDCEILADENSDAAPSDLAASFDSEHPGPVESPSSGEEGDAFVAPIPNAQDDE